MKYKGIELEGLDKKVKLSHSRVMETDEGTDWIDKLLTCDKAALTPTQFHEVSALSSVINMDYQICNGASASTSSTVTTRTALHTVTMTWRIWVRAGRSPCSASWRHSEMRPFLRAGMRTEPFAVGRGSFDFWIGSRSSRWMGASGPTSAYRAMWLFSARHMRSTSASHTESPRRKICFKSTVIKGMRVQLGDWICSAMKIQGSTLLLIPRATCGKRI